MKILLSGSSGLVGSSVLERFFYDKHEITCLKRSTKNGQIWNTDILKKASFDAVIHLAGDNIASARWSKKKKQSIYNSRIHGTRELIRYLHGTDSPPKTFISASAIGFYGDRGDELLDENKSKGSGFLSDICNDWEKETLVLAKTKKTRIANLRFGMILSPKGGALAKMLPPFKTGFGGKLGNGNQYLSWISINDVTNIISYVLNNQEISGAINAVSPIPTTNEELTNEICKVLSKKPFLPLPQLAVKLIFGKQMAEEMLLSSARVTPEKLTMAGYKFIDQSLNSTLKFCLNKN